MKYQDACKNKYADVREDISLKQDQKRQARQRRQQKGAKSWKNAPSAR